MKLYRRQILIFAKAPEPGKVKTRLQPHLDPVVCAKLQEFLTIKTLSMACRSHLAPVELWATPTPIHPFFQACKHRFPINIRIQTGNNLGERMHQALSQKLVLCEAAVIIGTDCPAMSAQYIESAFELLEAGKDIVLGPAKDGGYVLIGVRRTHSTLFTDIAWGSNHVLAQTRMAIEHLGWSWNELENLQDVDQPEDLSYLGTIIPRWKQAVGA